jgi:tetrahydromethanopterin S-methyltransferase subunit H
VETTQKTYAIDDVQIGGQPGELPTVLVGNIFYKGMPEVSNHKKGTFDERKISKWMELAETLSERSGVPHLLDVMAMYPEAMSEYIAFLADRVDSAFLVDGANPETRIRALETVQQLGLEEHVVFNGITPKTSQEELTVLRTCGVKAAILMAYNELDYSPEGRISILRGDSEQRGLLSMAKDGGIEELLVDTVVFDVPSISYAAAAIRLIKKELGYPAGCSPANATYAWREAVKDTVLGEGFAASNASAHMLTQCWGGADFLIYGPIKQARSMIPASALNDAIIAYYNMKRFGTKPSSKKHPLYKIF